ncbi:hypothetical protein DMN91_012852 [Ooceraea biroi]|uniref:FAD dependent oxidoreductase domain-containing protein n=1 Tax=Ooceraea biroi TaxID=2015173 RepID=A0A3L8D382_OOCBI|nr:hypothetical protein DMN91_012852 [Ooceraea biroi]
MKIAVVGGGVIGLTTAFRLQYEFMRNAEITVFAESFDNIVSYTAAGIFRVGTSYCGASETNTRKWINDSYEYYDNIRRIYEASRAGNHWLEPLVPIYRKATEEELQLHGDWKYGSFFSTLLTQCDLYLPWIKQRLQSDGVTFKQRYLKSLKELVHNFDIIMNCTGLGARSLCDDKRLVAVRGQVYKVNAPWIKMFCYGELDTYVIPNLNGAVTLGGTRNFDCENMTICPYESAAIFARCRKLIPSLANAQLIRQEVGLRPHREGGIKIGRGTTDNTAESIIVDNYGHDGYGVSMAPGTASEAIHTAIQLHTRSSFVSKL